LSLSPSTPGWSLLQSAFYKLCFAASLALGVSLFLSLLFDSGLFGDPAVMQVGRKGGAAEIGAARARLGIFSEYHPAAITLRLEGAPRRLLLSAVNGKLVISNTSGQELRRIDPEDRNIEQVFATWVVAEKGLLKFEVDSELASLPALGLCEALSGSTLSLDNGGEVALGWAQRAPLSSRIFTPCLQLLRFDFGNTLKGRPVLDEMIVRAPRSLTIALPAFLLTLFIALSLALWCLAAGGMLNRTINILSALGMSLSSVVWIMLLQKWLAADLAWFPVYGWQSPVLSYAILPIIVWVCVGLWPEWRFWRERAGELKNREFMFAARARGLSQAQCLRRHLLINLAPTVVVQVLGALPFLALGSLLLERFFGIPGLGALTADAVRDGDVAVLRASAFCLALLFLMLQFLCDLMVVAIDPRAHSREVRG